MKSTIPKTGKNILISDLKVLNTSSIHGWIIGVRKHAKIIFIDVRDRTGTVQCVIKKDVDSLYEAASKYNIHSHICLEGEVLSLSKPYTHGHPNKYIEINVLKVLFHNTSQQVTSVPVERLRSLHCISMLKLRSNITQYVHTFFSEIAFLHVDTPILTKSTPEGARDFLVFNRRNKSTFYALPQSPQLFKQILMVGGVSRYYQIARCFRDEDSRSNRQAEFTQIDFEMSAVDSSVIKDIAYSLVRDIVSHCSNNIKLHNLVQLTAKEAYEFYGNDSPDLSIEGCTITRHGESFAIDFPFIVDKTLLSDTTEASFVYKDNSTKVIAKHRDLLGSLRNEIGKAYKLHRTGLYPVWINDFDMFSKSHNIIDGVNHHPFAALKDHDDIANSLSQSFDLVINGAEVAGGSMRNINIDSLFKVFALLGYSQDYVYKHFGFFVDALSSGAPEHGGIAIGFERLVMMLIGTENIQDAIPFPKTKKGNCTTTHAPSEEC